MNIYIGFLFFIAVTVSCNSNYKYDENVPILYFNVDSSYQKAEIFVTQILKLETTDSSVVGLCHKIIEYEDSFYLLDYDARDVKKFDSQGRFINKIGRVGRGVHEYISISDININKWKNSLDMLDPRGKLVSYNLSNGTYYNDIILEVNVPEISYFFWKNSEIVVLNSFFQDTLLHFYSRSMNSVIKSLIESNWIRTSGGGTFARSPFWQYDGNLNFIDEHSLDVYSIKDGEVDIRYNLYFGESNFEFIEIENMKIDNLDKFLIENKKAFPIINCFENEVYFGFGISYDKQIEYFLINKRNLSILSLPLGDYDYSFLDFEAFANGLNVGVFRSVVFNPAQFNRIFKEVTLTPEIERSIEKVDENDNPWIVTYEVR